MLLLFNEIKITMVGIIGSIAAFAITFVDAIPLAFRGVAAAIAMGIAYYAYKAKKEEYKAKKEERKIKVLERIKAEKEIKE